MTEKTLRGFLLAVMIDRIKPNRHQMRAATAAVKYFHIKPEKG